MAVILILLAALVGTGLVLYLTHRPDAPTSEEQASETEKSESEECCGLHMTCERDSLLAAVSPEIVYYDDEELDRFAGRLPQSYTPEDADEFRDILLSMRPDDIAGWSRSLQLRGIALPADVREELLMIVAEERQKRSK